MRLTIEVLHHTLTIDITHDEPEDPDSPTQHDAESAGSVELSGNEPNARAELDQRMGFRA